MERQTQRRVVEHEHLWIPMPDGCRLAARLWLPEDAEEQPVPLILEYIPYRKRDNKALRDSQIHPYFARHGYASLRVDLRGSGDSEGILRDEYLTQEWEDGLTILEWAARQPWCTGDAGMFGLSWGGFNGLQLAALRPPQLRCIITVCSSDNRYSDDVHYMGGCLLTDNLSWASTMFAFNACPPDPALVGERWRDMWLERLEGSGLWLESWLGHQRLDDYWRHGSVCFDYSAIQVPVFAVSGWADGYTNPVFRLVENLDVPTKGLIGPWGHTYPNLAAMGPETDFLGESLRWYDQWLKGVDTGVMRDPALQVWMQDTVSPLVAHRPGRWVGESQWPSPNRRDRRFHLSRGQLLAAGSTEPDQEPRHIMSPLSVGLFAGKWCSYASETDLPWDQREEDGGALVFDTPPLAEDLEILGGAELTLGFSSNKPLAMVAVRLSDVGANDRASRVTYGLLNLAHRDSSSEPEELQPDHRYTVTVPLNYVAQRFPAGHRIRLSISTSYWPLAWPSPEPVRLTIYPPDCVLSLPERPQPADELARPHLGEPHGAEPLETELLAPAHREWKVLHNLATNEVSLDVRNNDMHYRLPAIDLELERRATDRYSYHNNDYATVRGETTRYRGFRRGSWHAVSTTHTVLTSTRTHFCISAQLDAYDGDARLFSASWNERIPRDMV